MVRKRDTHIEINNRRRRVPSKRTSQSETLQKDMTIEDAIIEVDDLMNLPVKPKEMILNPFIPEQSITLIYGKRGIGKTWVIMSLLYAITRGEAFGPWDVKKPIPCLYLDGEMPISDIIERFKALNYKKSKSKCPLYIYSESLAYKKNLGSADLSCVKWRDKMRKALIYYGVKLWAIDNLSLICGNIDEDDKRDWEPINSWIIKLRHAGISTIMIHHAGKKEDQRGTSAREDNIDTSIKLVRPSQRSGSGAQFVWRFTKNRNGLKGMDCSKAYNFHLLQDHGKVHWDWEHATGELKRRIIEMLKEGEATSVISRELQCSDSYVSQIKNKLGLIEDSKSRKPRHRRICNSDLDSQDN